MAVNGCTPHTTSLLSTHSTVVTYQSKRFIVLPAKRRWEPIDVLKYVVSLCFFLFVWLETISGCVIVTARAYISTLWKVGVACTEEFKTALMNAFGSSPFTSCSPLDAAMCSSVLLWNMVMRCNLETVSTVLALPNIPRLRPKACKRT